MSVRSESSRKAILDATMDLLARDGRRAITVQKLTVEAIADRAGVGKATIYRWWPSKVAVVIDASWRTSWSMSASLKGCRSAMLSWRI